MIKTMRSVNVMRLGLLCLVLGQLTPRILGRSLGVADTWTDPLMGFFIGAAIALLLVSLRKKTASSCEAKS